MSEGKKYDVFLSYSSKDRPWVLEFTSALRKAGVTAWFDVEDLDPGEHWQEKLQEALRQSSILVVILTENSINNQWMFFELGAAVAGGKTIIPVLAEDMDINRVPLSLTRFQFLREFSAFKAGKKVAEVIEKSKP
jgi:hypothetical protein